MPGHYPHQTLLLDVPDAHLVVVVPDRYNVGHCRRHLHTGYLTRVLDRRGGLGGGEEVGYWVSIIGGSQTEMGLELGGPN